jgi:hypothetical protein
MDPLFYTLLYLKTWAYGKEKIRGTERNLPDFFGLCPSCQKNFPEKLSKIVVDGGGGGRSDYEKFLLDSTFPTKLTEFPTKVTEFVPFIFIISQYCPTVKRILPDWLCLPSKLGGVPRPRPVRPCLKTTPITVNMILNSLVFRYPELLINRT